MTSPQTLNLEFGVEFLSILNDLEHADGTVLPIEVQHDMANAFIESFMEVNELEPMSLVWGLTIIARMLGNAHGLYDSELIRTLRNTVQIAKERNV